MKNVCEEIQLVSVSNAACRLGIKEDTLRHWLCERRFPYVKVGGRTMIAVTDLREFVQQNRVKVADSATKTEVEQSIADQRRVRNA